MRKTAIDVHKARARVWSWLLVLALLFSLLPAAAPVKADAAWVDPYLQKLVSWGIMRGDADGGLRADDPLSRAEFVAMVNRAYGYDKTGKMPFSDVETADWFYDDIGIGYNAGYFNGTSPKTASPQSATTREQATAVLGRILVLEPAAGEDQTFVDSRSISTWSRGLVSSAASEGIVHGYSDGSFRPTWKITRGEMAVLLVNAIGTPLHTPGTYTLGGTYGNVTISTSGVTLKDTTIAGNLYIAGGVGLGYTTLENVTVLGKVVVCGAGESNQSENSVVFRNVTAPTLTVDNLTNQYVSLRAEGDTKFDTAYVRTHTYLEDATEDGYGFLDIRVDGESGTQLETAGNVKQVTALTDSAVLQVAKGTAKTVTVDEHAPSASVIVGRGAAIGTLNLDAAATISGEGSIQQLNVSAANCSSTLLPDRITVRPGLTAQIAGSTMDAVTAAESSATPRLLSGYPVISILAPTSSTAEFRTNKAGVVYWALTSISDGSVGEDALLAPATSTKIVKSGSVKTAASNTSYTAAISGLTSGGSYYLSAMLVDARGQHSTVKTIAFTTPDNTVPNFASGYPYMSKITSTAGQVAVMPTKTCQLYYALLPKNSAAPTSKDFKANAVSGNLGFGVLDVIKNAVSTFYVNKSQLAELGTYDLYLWLTDADGAHSSSVKKLSFTTVDGTPPVFVTAPVVTTVKETSVSMNTALNEAGTVYWVAVKEGEEYPKPLSGQTDTPALDSDVAKLQVANGMNALKSGKLTVTANKDATISVSGLTAETAYDVYYVAQDKAGNYSAAVGKLTIHTLDTKAPTITQTFTKTNDTEGKSPLADTDVNLIFSESVQDTATNQPLLALYQQATQAPTEAERKAAAAKLAEILRADIQLYEADRNPAVLVSDPAVINYSNVAVTAQDGKVIVTFPHSTEAAKSAINLKSGSKYYFQIQNISDTSNNRNIIKPNPTKLEAFTTVFAQLSLSSSVASATVDGSTVDFDMSFKAVPISTASVDDSIYYDLLFRASSNVSFDLYTRKGDGAWTKADGSASILTTDGSMHGASYAKSFRSGTSSKTSFEPLKQITESREYGLVFTSYNGNPDRATWNGRVEMQVDAVAGSSYADLNNLSISDVTDTDLTAAYAAGITSISNPEDYTMRCRFTDSIAPEFQTNFPATTPSDITAVMNVQLTRSSGVIYYVVAPLSTIRTILKDADSTLVDSEEKWKDLPTTTSDNPTDMKQTATPTSYSIMNPSFSNSLVKTGHISYYGSTVPIRLSELEPETEYCAYFVLQGDSQNVYSDAPYIFRFQTTEVSRPIITLDINNPSVNITVDSTATVDYLLAVNGKEPGDLREQMSKYVSSTDQNLFTAGGLYADYTVLQAMSEDSYQDGTLQGSLFDVYATQSAKEKFATYIRSQTPAAGSVTLKNSVKISAGQTTSVNCSGGMSGDSWYTFLAVGRSAVGSGDAFRAIRPVFNKDLSAPVITSCTIASPSVISSPNDPCSGSLAIQFSEELYWREQKGVEQITTPLEAKAGPGATAGFIAAGTVFERNSSRFTLLEGTAGQKISSVRFKVKNAYPGDSINVPVNVSDKSGNVHKSPLALVLQYKKGDDGTYVPYFTITKEWDNTDSK